MDRIYFQIAEADRDLTPAKQHPSDAAYDLRAAAPMTLAAGEFRAEIGRAHV